MSDRFGGNGHIFNTMWRSTRHQTTWVRICVFTFVYSFVGSHAHSNEYYIRRGYKLNEQPQYAKQDIFGYPKCSALDCLQSDSFNSEPLNPIVRWPGNITLCTYRCGYIEGIGLNTFLPEENKCVNNQEVRRRLGRCMMLFEDESPATIPLFVLDVNNSSLAQPFKWFQNDYNSQCQVNSSGQHYYIGGNDTWKKIPTSSIYFYISKNKLKWNSTNAIPYLGRIIKLQLQNCRNANWPSNVMECLLFKAKGIFHYQPFVTSTVKLEPYPTTSTLQQRSLHATVPLTSASYVKVSHSSTSPTVTTIASPLIPSTSDQVVVVVTSTGSARVSHSSTIVSSPITTLASQLIHVTSTSDQVVVVVTSTGSARVSHSSTIVSSPITTVASQLIHVTSTSDQVVVTSTGSARVSHSSTIVSSPITTVASQLIYVPSTLEQVSVVMTPISTPTTSAQSEGSTTPPPKGDSSGQERSNMDSVIIGVVTPCVIVIIACLLVAVWCKRRSNHKERSYVKAANPSADNPAYERNNTDQIIPLKSTQKRPQVNEDYDNIEYDYATVDGVQVHTNKKQPVYQSLDRDNANVPQIYQSLLNNPDLNKPGLNKDNADSKEEYSYNHLQHPAYNPPHPKGTSDSSYNSLQKPVNDDYLEPGTQINDNQPGASEPVYNVLEDPDANQHPQDNDPVYNVLEDPDANQHPQDNDPVYNVLEDPDANQHPQDNDPIYNVLEDPDDDYDNAPTDDDQNLPPSGQDNAAYSSTIDLKMPQRPSSPDYDVLEGPDGALPDSTYQPLGIRVQDDVYQPLDRRSHSIYQSLEPGDSAA